MLGTLFNIALTALAVGLLILVHEVGHFVAAKIVGVRVEVFSIGFWKKIFSFRRGGTEYRLSVIPLGGYVRLAGESPDADGAPDELWSKTPAQRALIFSGGVVFNVALAVAAFVVAFAAGVPFTVAEVGSLDKDWPAWLAGMRVGDRIIRVDDKAAPDFEDVMRTTALGDKRVVSLRVKRGDEVLEFALEPRFDPKVGFKRLGFRPPFVPVVNGFVGFEERGGRSPAEDAGVQIGERVVSFNGRPVGTVGELSDLVADHPEETVTLELERDGERRTVEVRVETFPQYMIGISGFTTTLKSLQKGGRGDRAGLKTGDRVVKVNGRPVTSVLEIEMIIKESYGNVGLTVSRDGGEVELTCDTPDRVALRELMSSIETESGNVLTWVRQGGPAYNAGMRVGDAIMTIGGERVSDWADILKEGAQHGKGPRVMEWTRDGESFSAQVTPVNDHIEKLGHIGIYFRRTKTARQRLGVFAASKRGVCKTFATIRDIVFQVRGYVRGQVGGKSLGGVVLIAQISYEAARQGLPKLLYFLGIVSTTLAFINILPIPVLDGGHLLFLAIEKVRGKPLSEPVMAVAQYIGLALLLALMVYATANDIVRLLHLS